MEIAARLGLPVLLHAESAPVLAALGAGARGTGAVGRGTGAVGRGAAVREFLESRPVLAELEAINRALLYAEETGCRIHVVHVSTRRGVELVRRAVAAGRVDATAETCPHYLFFSDRDLEAIGPRAKCAPPLRGEALRREQVVALLAGEIDIVASDHSPAPPELKDRESFSRAWGGIPGVQTTLRTLLTLEVPPERIAAVVARNPADRFALPGKGLIAPGYDADFALVDIRAQATLTREELRDRHGLSPYVGRRLAGRIDTVFLRGREIDETAWGRFVRPRVLGPGG